jgi:hypothetical protein
MATRTITSTVVFKKPFLLSGLDEEQSPGSYQVETDEEQIEDVSFVAYRRLATFIHLHPSRDQPGIRQTLTIDPVDLERALRMDQQPDEADPFYDQPFKVL